MNHPEKDAYHFRHDSNAQHDERILELRAEYGWEGYGLYWAIIERMRDAPDYRLATGLIGGLSIGLGVSKALLAGIIDLGVRHGLFAHEQEAAYFYSPSLRRRMEGWDKKRATFSDAGKLGAERKALLRAARVQAERGIDQNCTQATLTPPLSQPLHTLTPPLSPPLREEQANRIEQNRTEEEVLCKTDVSHTSASEGKLVVLPAATKKNKRGDADPMFEDFWGRYDKKVNRKRTEVRWGTLSAAQQQQALARVDAYVKATPDPKFRKDPSGWLYDERFADEQLPPISRPEARAFPPQPPRARHALQI